MKQIFFTAAVMLVVFACKKEKTQEEEQETYTCTTYQGTNLPVGGDTILMYSDTLTNATAGSAGIGVNWDFSDATKDDSSDVVFLLPSSTPYAALFPTATMAVKDEDQFIYLKQNPDGIEVIGAVGDLEGNTVDVSFDDTYNLIDYPLAYGQTLNDSYSVNEVKENLTVEFGGQNITADSVKITRTGSVYRNVDACGEIKTPSGTYSVLRVYSEEINNDLVRAKVSIGVPPFQIVQWFDVVNEQDTIRRYEFLSNETKLPIVTLDLNADLSVKQVNYIP